MCFNIEQGFNLHKAFFLVKLFCLAQLFLRRYGARLGTRSLIDSMSSQTIIYILYYILLTSDLGKCGSSDIPTLPRGLGHLRSHIEQYRMSGWRNLVPPLDASTSKTSNIFTERLIFPWIAVVVA